MNVITNPKPLPVEIFEIIKSYLLYSSTDYLIRKNLNNKLSVVPISYTLDILRMYSPLLPLCGYINPTITHKQWINVVINKYNSINKDIIHSGNQRNMNMTMDTITKYMDSCYHCPRSGYATEIHTEYNYNHKIVCKQNERMVCLLHVGYRFNNTECRHKWACGCKLTRCDVCRCTTDILNCYNKNCSSFYSNKNDRCICNELTCKYCIIRQEFENQSDNEYDEDYDEDYEDSEDDL